MIEKLAPKLAARFMKFTTIGAISSLAYVVFVAALVEFLDVRATSATLCAYAMALPISYFGNRSFTYASTNPILSESAKFLTVHGTNAAVAYGECGSPCKN